MVIVLNILIGLSLLSVLVILGLGFYSLNRGGAFAEKWSNRLMRYRIAAQATAACLVLLGLVLKATHQI
jgi:hypothetical protein